jgi:hypothetical protein
LDIQASQDLEGQQVVVQVDNSDIAVRQVVRVSHYLLFLPDVDLDHLLFFQVFDTVNQEIPPTLCHIESLVPGRSIHRNPQEHSGFELDPFRYCH